MVVIYFRKMSDAKILKENQTSTIMSENKRIIMIAKYFTVLGYKQLMQY